MIPPRKWKSKDKNGKFIVYRRGDVVSKKGKLYSAIRTTTLQHGSPEHGKKAGWKELTENRIKNYTENSDAPVDPVVGDEWYDSSSGNLYKFVDDGTSTQWVET
jgi:hypothetical protein